MMYRDHFRSFFQESQMDTFVKYTLETNPDVHDLIKMAARDAFGQTVYTVAWNEGWSLED